MLHYRLYCFDGAGKVWAAEWLEAASDQDAVQAAHRMDVGIKCELWEGKRLVATIEPHSGAARRSSGLGAADLTV
jgi:hypothetical protein